MKGINVLSTFNGMGCIWYALDRNNIKVNKRYSCEIDKYANQGNDVAYPNTIQLGDVTKVKARDLEKIDLFVGGSPCQGFSFAGKQLAFDDPRSKLFFEFVRLWNEIKKINPDAKFLLENVQMKKNELRIISEYMGVFPVNINSNLVSAQNRNRWYWSNIKTKEVGLFNEIYTDIPQPEDKGILLKDILQDESEINEKYYLKNPKLGFEGMDLNKKSNTLRTGGKGSQTYKHNCDIIKVDKKGNEKADQNKAGCLTAGGHSGGNHSDMDIIAVKSLKDTLENGLIRELFYDKNNKLIPGNKLNVNNAICVSQVGRRIDENGIRKDNDKTIPAVQQLELAPENKTNCITTVAKDNLILIGGIKEGLFKKGVSSDFSQGARVYSTEGKAITQTSGGGGLGAKTGLYIIQKARGFNKGSEHSEKVPTLTSNSWDQNNILKQDYKLRRLTVRECGKLQTFTDAELDVLLNAGISDTQLYKMFGNGWTVDVIAHILSFY